MIALPRAVQETTCWFAVTGDQYKDQPSPPRRSLENKFLYASFHFTLYYEY